MNRNELKWNLTEQKWISDSRSFLRKIKPVRNKGPFCSENCVNASFFHNQLEVLFENHIKISEAEKTIIIYSFFIILLFMVYYII